MTELLNWSYLEKCEIFHLHKLLSEATIINHKFEKRIPVYLANSLYKQQPLQGKQLVSEQSLIMANIALILC